MSRVVVVGAGVSGLVGAGILREAGHDVTVVDKGRGVGGRTATRRFAGAVFDHGAQFFTTKSAEGAAVVDGWRAAGAVEVWHERLLEADGESRHDGHLRLRGAPSMTGPAKLLARDLADVRLGSRITRLAVEGALWRCHLDGEHVDADGLLVTAPVPQLLELLPPEDLADGVATRLAGVRYHRCIAVLVRLDRPAGLPEPGAVRPGSGPVEWVADNEAKGVSPVPALTIHLRPEPSVDWWGDADEVVVDRAMAAVRPWTGAGVVDAQVQRWRFARPVEVLPERSLVLRSDPPALAAGDVFGGPLVEGALRSGLDAGRRLREMLGPANGR